MNIDPYRFWSKVDKRGPDECWEWQAYRKKSGHGEFRVDRHKYKIQFAHRVAYALEHGIPLEQLPEVLRHKCDNPPCCNPRHLLPGTHQLNVADRVERNRSARGTSNGRARLTADQVQEVLASTESGVILAQRFGVHYSTISKIRQGKNWRGNAS